MRQNTKTVRANSVRELTEIILNATAALAVHENAEVYLRGARSYSSLTSEEKFRFGMLVGFSWLDSTRFWSIASAEWSMMNTLRFTRTRFK